eukprot:2291329-Alexandrium_andersonii.AAC.1
MLGAAACCGRVGVHSAPLDPRNLVAPPLETQPASPQTQLQREGRNNGAAPDRTRLRCTRRVRFA